MQTLINFLTHYGPFLGVFLVFLALLIWVYLPGAKNRPTNAGNLRFFGGKKDGARYH